MTWNKTKLKGITMLIGTYVLFLSAIAQPNSSAPFEVKWGKTFEGDKRSFLQDLIGYDETGFYVVTGKVKKSGDFTDGTFQIQHFDHSLALRRSESIELKTNDKYETMEAFVQMNKQVYLFTSQANFKTKEQTLRVRGLDKRTLKAESGGQVVARMPTPSGLVVRPNLGQFTIRLSQDSSYVMVVYALPYKKGEPEKFGVHVFDNGMKEAWHQEITLPYRDELFEFVSMKISNDGTAFVLGKYYKDKAKDVRQGKPNYEYKILAYSASETKGKEYPVAAMDKFITDMQIGVLANGDVACAGFYSDEGVRSIRGTFFVRIDGSTAKIEATNFKEFDVDFLTQNLKEKQAEKLKKKEERGGDVELYEYDLDELVLREDGGVVLVGEQYYVNTYTYTTTTNGMTQTQTSTSYYYGDIIAVTVNPQGIIEWATVLPKRQVTGGYGIFYFSYSLAVVRDKLYVVYNDDPKNIDFKKPGTPKALTGAEESIIMVNQIDGSGKVTRHPIFSSFGADLTFWPNVSEQISESDLILFAKRKRDQQFIRITFK